MCCSNVYTHAGKRVSISDTAASMTTDSDLELMRRSESNGKASHPPVSYLQCC